MIQMYRCAIFLMIISLTVFAGDEKLADAGMKGRTPSSDHVSETPNAHQVNLQDIQKFYIGFTGVHSDKQLITLDIHPMDSLNNEIRFQYIMNSLDAREDGNGKLYVDLGIVEFNNLFAGKFYRNHDQKIVFESLQENSSTYWKMKEK